MKKKRNKGKKKGFSMVELLAAITILGILMAVAIGSVSVYLEKSRKDYFDSQRKNIIAAAKSYYQSNKSELPKNIGDVSEVDLKTLINDKYIGEVYSNDKKTPCDADETKVKVVMSDKGKYKYSSTFVCQGIESEDETTGGDDATFEYDKIKNEDTYTLTVKSNNGTKIKHYTYTVTKNGYNYVGPIEEKVNTANLNTRTFTIDRESDNPMNTFIATVRIVDEKGKTHVGVITFTLGDDIKPTCTNIWTDLHEWSKTKTQNITFDCTDPKDTNGYASGCQKDKYHVRLKTKADVDTYKNGIKIKDNAGNEFTCPIQDTIRLDFEAPSCPAITGYEKTSSANITTPGSLPKIASGTWSKKWIFTQATGSKDNAVGKNNNGAGFDYYKVSTTGTTDPANGVKQSYRNVNSEGLSTVSYQACDKLGNCTTSCGSYSVKLDRTPPTNPTVGLYKWNGTTTPTSSSGLSTYPNNTWFSGRVFTNATGSTDALRGGVYYQYKTTGKTTNQNNVTSTYRNITEEGISYISYRACDGLNNCTGYTTNKTIKLDRTAPTKPTVSLYKWKNVNTKPTSSSGLSAYSNNTWFDGKVYTQASGSKDNLTSVSYQYTTTGKTTNETGKTNVYRNVEAEGISYIKYRSCDEAGNCSAYTDNSTIKLDRTAPTKPTVNLYKWKNVNTKPTSSSGLSAYSNNSWFNGKVYTTPSGSTDSGSGVTSYQYTTTGKTTNDTNKVGSSRNIEAEGSSTIKYRACDALNHCSSYSDVKTIKLDRTAPKITSWTKGSYSDSDTYKDATGKASDSLSGVESYAISTSSSPSSYTWHDIGNKAGNNTISIGYQKSKSSAAKSYYYFAKDKAGNIGKSSNTVKQYKICQLTKSTERDAAVYKISDKSTSDCGGSSHKRTMNVNNIKCYGKFDKYHNVYCSHRMTNKSSEKNYGHSGNIMKVYYDSKAHCKQNIKTANTHVKKICEGEFKPDSSHPERFVIDHGSSGKEYQFHGYRFFTKSCTNSVFCDFSKFMNVWVHQPISKDAPAKYDARHTSSSATAACEKEFKSMSTNYDDYE